jgi:hypothetical protein
MPRRESFQSESRSASAGQSSDRKSLLLILLTSVNLKIHSAEVA